MVWTVQRLLDQAAIRDVHLRYCRGVDRMDWALVRACYHPDGTEDHGAYTGSVDGFIDWVGPTLANYKSTTHFTGNQLVEVEGDLAWAERYGRVYLRRPATAEGPEADIVANVRYVDRMERRHGEWRIAARIVVVDSDRVDPVGATWAGPNLERGRRDKSDVSYRRLPA